MVDSLRIVVNDKEVISSIPRLEKNIGKGAARVVINSARYAFKVAKNNVPVDTSETKKAIMSVVAVTKKGLYESRVGFDRNPHPEKTWSGGEFNLPAWMHHSTKANMVKWRNGKTNKFLQIASEMSGEKFGRDAEVMIGNIKW